MKGRRLAWPGLSFLFIISLFFLFHREVFFEGKVYLNSWIFRSHVPFSAAAPSSLNFLNQNSDHVTHYFAHKYFIAQSLRAGETPLWDPFSFSGFPIYATGSSAVFSPLNLLLLKMDPYVAYNIVLAGVFLGGALLLYYYLSSCLRLSSLSSLAGVLSLIFCPLLMEQIDFDTLLVFVWAFPLILVVCEKWRRDETFPGMPVLAFTLLITALTSHIHTALYALLLAVAYRTAIFRDYETPGRCAANAAGTALLFLGMSAFVWLPVADFFIRSQFISAIPAGDWTLQIPWTPITSVYPVFLKLPGASQWIGHISIPHVAFAEAPDLGLIANLLGLVSLTLVFNRKAEPRIRFFALVALIYHVVLALPGNLFIPGAIGSAVNVLTMKFWQFFVLAGAILCAFGFESVFVDDRFRRYGKRLVSAVLVLIVLPATLLSLLLTFFPEICLDRAMRFARIFSSSGVMAPQILQHFTKLRELAGFSSIFMWMPALFTCIFFLLLRSHEPSPAKSTRRRWILFVLLVADLFLMGRRYLPVPVGAKDLFVSNPAIEFLRSDASVFRILSLQSAKAEGEAIQTYVFKPNLSTVYGLQDAGGQESLLSGRYSYFSQKYLTGDLGRTVTPGGILDFESVDLAAAGFINVKYLIVSEKSPRRSLKEVFRGNGVILYENPRLLPRIFYTRKQHGFTTFDDACHLMSHPVLDGEPEVAVEGFSTPPAFSPGGPPPTVRVEKEGLAGYSASFVSEQPGLLVFTDSYDPGWVATDNSKAVPILRINGLFNGVRLGAGRHEVHFAYRPVLLKKTLWISAFFVLAALALCLRLTAKSARDRLRT